MCVCVCGEGGAKEIIEKHRIKTSLDSDVKLLSHKTKNPFTEPLGEAWSSVPRSQPAQQTPSKTRTQDEPTGNPTPPTPPL